MEGFNNLLEDRIKHLCFAKELGENVTTKLKKKKNEHSLQTRKRIQGAVHQGALVSQSERKFFSWENRALSKAGPTCQLNTVSEEAELYQSLKSIFIIVSLYFKPIFISSHSNKNLGVIFKHFLSVTPSLTFKVTMSYQIYLSKISEI